MHKEKNQKSIEQEKMEATIIWETQTNSLHHHNVIAFPNKKEATYQEKTILQGESEVKIHIVSSGFGNLQGCMSSSTMQLAA